METKSSSRIRSGNASQNGATSFEEDLLHALIAFRDGDFSTELPLREGIEGKIAATFNACLLRNRRIVDELARLSNAVGREGQVRKRASIDAEGQWRAAIDAANGLVDDLVYPMTETGRVLGAVARGDLTQRMPLEYQGRPLRGEFLRSSRTINTMVDQLNGYASEVTRVAREVGSDGKLGGQAVIKGVEGTWKDLTDSVNFMASNLTAQVRNIADVTTAVANGDLSKKITVAARGEILNLKGTINTMVDQLNAFASEVTRVAREVGSEGILGGQAQVSGVSGTWKDLTESVNVMAGNLTAQVRNIAEVTTAVARGDLSKKITVDVRGEIAELKGTINTMVDQLNSFASEVTRVAREVGSEGILGGQAEVGDAAGTWKALTDSVNVMAGNLTSQVRNIAEVTTAVAKGDLSKKITVDVRGEVGELKDTINTMVDQLNGFASEVTRVAREVGSEGILGGQAQVAGVSGTWKDLTDSVNFMAGNLTSQVRNIADVTTAVAKGDLSRKITVDVRGEIAELKETINTMVDQLNGFASEVTRVAREVGSEGKLGGQAQVSGAAGTWKDLTDSVNTMAGNLTAQVRNIADVTTAVARGDLSRKITVDVRGEILELKNTVNTMVDQLNAFASEVTRVAREVGSEGQLGGQAQVSGVSGTWKDLTDSVNFMASNLTSQVRNIAKVTTAVANGDLSRKITVDVRGEIAELKETINTMVDQLNAFASEVTRVAREVGSEGQLGGQARVQGVSGVWKDLTDNVNTMAANLTSQVRGIAEVVTSVANGDLKRKLTLQARGEIAQLAETINEMIVTLATFADQVTTVAREVGFEGRLGGQAAVPGAAGLWRDLTDSVNQLAAQLTDQIRAISEVATAVTKGDLSRTIEVAARGEVGELTRNVNEMIQNLRDTTNKNTEQDWFKSNLARFTSMLQGQRDINVVGRLIMSELAQAVSASAGAFYVVDLQEGEQVLKPVATYAVPRRRMVHGFFFGEGLVGQCATEKARILLDEVPADYMAISSGTGRTRPASLVLLPVLFEGEVKGVVELATVRGFSEIHMLFLDQLMQSIGVMINTITASTRTEQLLMQSQSLTTELQTQQNELKQTNDELEEQARLLQERNQEVERRTREIEEARGELEKKAEQLSLTSKYKSQFLANMSHELRTPLNSLLILSKQLADNRDGNMTVKQVEFAQTIRSAGSDLLTLINDILDLSKIESGTTAIELEDVRVATIEDDVRRTFAQMAADKGLDFEVRHEDGVPDSLMTDPTRLQQVLKNLVSNALKFTSSGSVSLTISLGRAPRDDRPSVLFSVRDTGIGIAPDKYHVIFEAFQQADMSTARKFGGTGLGLAISREIAGLLDAELDVDSTLGSGSTFTLFHPIERSGGRRHDAAPVREPLAVPDFSKAPLPRDDREAIRKGDPVLLVVEDDATFSGVLAGLARDRGFKVVLARNAGEALELADRFLPDAITLDVGLPDASGWQLLETLKARPATANVPVHIISGAAEADRATASGALAHLQKPASEEALTSAFDALLGFTDTRDKSVLVVEDDITQLNAMVRLISSGEMRVTAVTTGADALDAIERSRFDCLVIDLKLPDMSGEELIAKVHAHPNAGSLPVIVYTARDLTRDEESELRRISSAIIVKDARSPERLMDELTFFLQRVETELAPGKRGASADDATFKGRKVLIVDDDSRNILALEVALQSHGLQVISAESGRQGIETLQTTPVDIVLMDIMMPEMDGYETIRRIRADESLQRLPIVALTAKAMKGDRDACIAAGASEYVSKPVDVDQLVSLLRVWLSR